MDLLAVDRCDERFVQQPIHLDGDAVGLALGGIDLVRVLLAQFEVAITLNEQGECRRTRDDEAAILIEQPEDMASMRQQFAEQRVVWPLSSAPRLSRNCRQLDSAEP